MCQGARRQGAAGEYGTDIEAEAGKRDDQPKFGSPRPFGQERLFEVATVQRSPGWVVREPKGR
jgi:hypothetical protein